MTAETTVPNMPLIDAALAHIQAYPGEWDQQNWRCGTKGCMAFHIAQLSGAEWLMDTENDPKVIALRGQAQRCELGCCVMSGLATTYAYHDVVTVDGRIMRVRDCAREAAGLSHADAMVLFDGENTMAGLAGIAERLRAKAERLMAQRASHLAAVPPSPACDTGRTGPAREQDRQGSLHAV